MRQLRAALALACCIPSACTSWQQTRASDLQGLHPVRVQTAQQRYDFDRARLYGDSVVGEAGRPPRRSAIPVAEVKRIEEHRVSAGRTVGLVAGSVAVVVVGTALVVATLLAQVD